MATKKSSNRVNKAWHGRPDAKENEFIFQLIQDIDVYSNIGNKHEPGYVILGFKSDVGIRRNHGRVGASQGPKSFRKTFGSMPVYQKIDIYDAGDIICLSNNVIEAQEKLKTAVHGILSMGLMPIVVGGGHDTAWGHYQGIKLFYPKESVSILNFDSHFDLRTVTQDKEASSGTPFYQIYQLLKSSKKPFGYYCAGIQRFANPKSLFDFAEDIGVEYSMAEEINQNPNNLDFIHRLIKKSKKIYVSICLDALKSSISPGVSCPQPLGISPSYIINALRLLKKSKKVVSLDIVELSPKHDPDDLTSKLASLLLMEYLHA